MSNTLAYYSKCKYQKPLLIYFFLLVFITLCFNGEDINKGLQYKTFYSRNQFCNLESSAHTHTHTHTHTQTLIRTFYTHTYTRTYPPPIAHIQCTHSMHTYTYDGATTFSIMTLSIMTLSIMTFSIMPFSIVIN